MDRQGKTDNEPQVLTRTQRTIISVLRLTAWMASFVAFMHIVSD